MICALCGKEATQLFGIGAGPLYCEGCDPHRDTTPYRTVTIGVPRMVATEQEFEINQLRLRIAELEFERENVMNLLACAALLRQQIQFRKQKAILPDPLGAYVSATHYDVAVTAAAKTAKVREKAG